MTKRKKPFCAVLIVTYNSQLHLSKAWECLKNQTHPPDQIIIVDTGSAHLDYLSPYKMDKHVHIVIGEKNAGFCKGNNIGMSYVSEQCDYVFLLNPDAFLAANYLEQAIAFMEKPQNEKWGALTGVTLGYDMALDRPTGKYDTTGIFKTWYGRWYDRAQGQPIAPHLFQFQEEIPAICGAVFFCRKKALDDVQFEGRQIFDNAFYMYKEDIDLSIRLRQKRWHLIFHPGLIAYHCRGWNRERSKMARHFRLCSARNEIKIQRRLFSFPGMIYSGIKYFFVKFCNL